jgi:hypothetical protein
VNNLVATLIIGVGATASIDLWSVVRQRLLDVPPPNYGLVGRWLAHIPRGRLLHRSIATVEPMRRERLIGWTAHYLIGIAFAFILTGTWGAAWIQGPTIGPALIVGLGTVAAPFLVMQPAMGAGIASSRAARPAVARFHSLLTHGVFGLGLYGAGLLASLFYVP